jgi:hypothetical protein
VNLSSAVIGDGERDEPTPEEKRKAYLEHLDETRAGYMAHLDTLAANRR